MERIFIFSLDFKKNLEWFRLLVWFVQYIRIADFRLLDEGGSMGQFFLIGGQKVSSQFNVVFIEDEWIFLDYIIMFKDSI